MKKTKRAWVRYDMDEKTKVETYTLLFWSDADAGWREEMKTRFVADAKHPDGPTDFIHYSLLLRVIELVNDGWEVEI